MSVDHFPKKTTYYSKQNKVVDDRCNLDIILFLNFRWVVGSANTNKFYKNPRMVFFFHLLFLSKLFVIFSLKFFGSVIKEILIQNNEDKYLVQRRF